MKNEEKFVKRWADSCAQADYRILLDTGSSDNAVAVAKECGVIVHEKVFNPWRFDHARNHLLDLIPHDVDWIINLDVDEVLGVGWYRALEGVPTDGSITRPRYLYTWNWHSFVHDDDNNVDIWATIEKGKPGLQYHGDKITARFSHRWKHPVHEVNITREGQKEAQCFVDGLRIYHFADNTKSRGSYLPLLIQSVEEDPEDDRNTYYCARELYYYGRNEEAIKLFKRHLVMERSTWNAERAFSMRYLAKLIPDQAELWLLRACGEYPNGREPWFDLAKYYYNKQDWESLLFAAKRGLRINDKMAVYLNEAEAWGYMLYDMAALASYRSGNFKDALNYGKAALAVEPNDARLKDNLIWYKKALAKATVVIPTKSNIDGLMALISVLMRSEGISKVVVVADGPEAYNKLSALPESVVKICVSEGVGIHAMWNAGMALAADDDHVLFINDDVSLGTSVVSSLVHFLSEHDNVGLVCPHYAIAPVQPDIETTTTCRGRYDGTGGMAGFCMMLANDLVPLWRFDERMKWWYGDDDLVNWVISQGRKCVITEKATCHHAHSQTIDNDPPANFAAVVNNDKKIFEQKWSK